MQADDLADSVAAAAAHPITVQVISQGPGIWGSVATGLITAGAAIGAVMLTHKFTLRREKSASEEKQQRERYFIATELVFLLEQFAEGCASVARDNGFEHEHAFAPSHPLPELDYAAVTGDWRTLPVRLMYQLRELPVLKSESDRTIDAADFIGPEYDEFFEARQYEYTRLGLKAVILARRLRKLTGFPDSRLNATPWSAQRVLWEEWRRERKRRAVQALLHASALATFEVKNDMRRKAADDASDPGENA
ncbi:hypothetical protein LA637_p2014 (plasmid) [Erwinia amylovora LA637]|uniref:hypothetical protein n=1 Tax=Erwinia amylovora TaxID=552 RepID=UPI0003D5B3CC|nr:hypothetical protein [Erwinia amylovora]CDK23886.1 hypothetical protein LA637_p2014 [Erwinia amylovora LA637]